MMGTSKFHRQIWPLDIGTYLIRLANRVDCHFQVLELKLRCKSCKKSKFRSHLSLEAITSGLQIVSTIELRMVNIVLNT